VLAHGHPEGVGYGADAAQLDDLAAWIDVAGRGGLPLLRLVAGGPRLRAQTTSRERVDGTVSALRGPCAQAAERGVSLALENHADLVAEEIEEILERLAAPHLGVCFDTSNWVRVGEEPAAAAQRLAGRVRMVHLKDHVARPGDGITGPASAPYGEGEVDLLGVLDAILGAAPDTPVCVEIAHLPPGGDEVDLVEQAVAWLRAHEHRWPGTDRTRRES
jgi:sugar phosphate isomerase/epimerase